MNSEIIVDNFAGGGGASTGIELATGKSVDIAINHDPVAIKMHMANHPETEHYCESVWDVDPRIVTRGRPVGLAWFSPDCKHFSKAKGGKPVEKNIRGLAWVAVRWAATVRPRVIMLENVEEFKTWGPLTKEGIPDPRQKGRTFRSFVNALRRYGYKVEWKELRACDYGAPTIRKRFFLIARCDGRLIVWPEPTHGAPDSPEVQEGKLLPWRTAAEIIDWSIPCPSIFDRKKPLAENTLRRIARGMQKFVFENPEPFVMRVNFAGSNHHYCDSIREPLTTVTTKAEHLLVTPILGVNTTGHPGSPPTEPLRTITTGKHHMLLSPTMIQMGYGERPGQDPRVLDLGKPVGTVTAGGNKFGIATAFLAKHYGGGHVAEVRSFLLKYYGSADNGQSLDEPLHTVTTKDRFGLVTIAGVDYQIVDIGMRMLEPHELFAAQGFPEDYIIDQDHEGNRYPKSAQVARCGNAVPPPFAEHLVRANLPELCTGSGKALTLSRFHAAEQCGQLAMNL
ncbi:DNA cytosine methyltransferase [Paenibacillus alvei]|uniref:DNA cytosine methyltransferase n=1 Tax=Paenibacillus alvei TaxID=44250 RepID=UPI002281229D|nr:DNA cytosine methyltransferase [Paenibacillus alvei]MCY9758426.1 DNA cytosine methyltransferase [Paenibacillus alvei]